MGYLIELRVNHVTFTCSNSTTETLEKVIVDFEHISGFFSILSVVDFEQVNVS